MRVRSTTDPDPRALPPPPASPADSSASADAPKDGKKGRRRGGKKTKAPAAPQEDGADAALQVVRSIQQLEYGIGMSSDPASEALQVHILIRLSECGTSLGSTRLPRRSANLQILRSVS